MCILRCYAHVPTAYGHVPGYAPAVLRMRTSIFKCAIDIVDAYSFDIMTILYRIRIRPMFPIFVTYSLLWTVGLSMAMGTSPQHPLAYELIHRTFEAATERNGLIEVTCRDGLTAENLSVRDIKIWLNRTSVDDPDLWEREDVGAIEVHGCCSLRFNLTHQLEGTFTCGRRIDAANVQESLPRTLICKL